jgi:hypothetical protein
MGFPKVFDDAKQHIRNVMFDAWLGRPKKETAAQKAAISSRGRE